jgi:regulatory protein spx
MIVCYYNISNSSCRKAVRWFRDRNIPIKEKKIEFITRSDLLTALSLSDHGFLELLKNPNMSAPELKNNINKVLSMSFNESMEFVLRHPEVLRVPLILDENKLVLGYNNEDIRVFIPNKQRRHKIVSDLKSLNDRALNYIPEIFA